MDAGFTLLEVLIALVAMMAVVTGSLLLVRTVTASSSALYRSVQRAENRGTSFVAVRSAVASAFAHDEATAFLGNADSIAFWTFVRTRRGGHERGRVSIAKSGSSHWLWLNNASSDSLELSDVDGWSFLTARGGALLWVSEYSSTSETPANISFSCRGIETTHFDCGAIDAVR